MRRQMQSMNTWYFFFNGPRYCIGWPNLNFIEIHKNKVTKVPNDIWGANKAELELFFFFGTRKFYDVLLLVKIFVIKLTFNYDYRQ